MADELDKIKKILDGDQNNITPNVNFGATGLNMDQTLNQIKPGTLTYALNAALENFDASSVNYQNEQGNEFCLQFPSGYSLIGTYFINEKNKHIFFLVNSNTGISQIGYMDNNDCIYHVLVEAACLNFNVDHPIHKVVHKIANCRTEIYWTDGLNSRRYLDIENIPYLPRIDSDPCDPTFTDQLDCNQLKIQPNFLIPELEVTNVYNGGDLTAGTYQFAIQYADASGNPYTSYYSITNPTPIADSNEVSAIFDYKVGKSIEITINNLDTSGLYTYYNIAAIATVNGVVTPTLIGTFSIEDKVDTVTYTGQNNTLINLSLTDIFEKYPYYDIAQDLTAAQDILMWDGLTSIDRINYQQIASKVDLLWETYKIPNTENYANELNATNLRGYLRDEVYAFELVFLLKNGKQTDGFHIPGRVLDFDDLQYPDVPDTNPDFIGVPDYVDPTSGVGYSPYWKIYNTGSVTGFATGNPIGNATPYQYGKFAYWESTETYPCNIDVWGDLASKPIRHHKFPDVLVSPIFENPVYSLTPGFVPVMQNNAIFPIGVKVDISQIQSLVENSSLTQEQKDNIAGFKIVRGNRNTNQSIVGKGMLRNVGTYTRQEQTLYYPNYPYNDLNEDPFINDNSNAYDTLGQSKVWLLKCTITGTYEYTDINSAKLISCVPMTAGEIYEFCSLTRPKYLTGKACIGPATYNAISFDWTRTDYDPGTLKADIQYTCDNSPLRTESAGIVTGGNNAGCTSCVISPCGIKFNYMSPGTFPYIENGDGITDAEPWCTVAPQWPFPLALGELPPFSLYGSDSCSEFFSRTSPLEETCGKSKPLPAITSEDSARRQVFNSPDTSFSQPFLGDILKLENVMFGGGKAHFVPVRGNAKYRLLSRQAQQDALDSSFDIGNGDMTAVFTAYQAYLTIYVNGITRKNYAQSFNSIASYDYTADITNSGNKQRQLDINLYLNPGVFNVGDPSGKNINNFQRESSVYTKTVDKYIPLPFPNKTASLLDSNGNSLISDVSRFTIGRDGESDYCKSDNALNTLNYCNTPEKEQDISVVAYYASLKNIFENQWGQIYSYETVDTGFQRMFDISSYSDDVAFGGDTFINRFAYKTKLPFFIDNRVNGIDDSDIFYDEIGNVGYPKFWHSARSILYTYRNLINIVSIKAHSFDCYNDPATIPADKDGAAGTLRTFYDGYFYMFAYGVPNFYCESNYNVDLRQAFNLREGDFWPHVSTSIPDDWVQEEFTSIAYDNSYFYNVTFSKQNKENFFSHLPADWNEQLCFTNYPFRVVYSDPQINNADTRVNNWLSYSPLSLFDFPQNYGNLISLDGIQNRAILARFENKSLLYNNLLTMNTSNPQAAYLGNPSLFTNTPIDFAETDLGFVGSQNKFFLKIPQGQITVDAKRGQVFLLQGNQVDELSGFGSGVNRFMTDHLAFEILRYFPEVDTDNHFNGIGLHGVYDTKFERVIITKLDYIPIDKDVKYDPVTKEFYVETIVDVILPTTTSTTSSAPVTTTSTSSTITPSTSSTTTTSTTIVFLPTTEICDQEWVTINLDRTTYINGDIIPQANNEADLAFYFGQLEGCWSYPNFDPANGAIYGKLYNWFAINDPRGLAPVGYHIPSQAEWNTLNVCLGGSLISGGKLKEVGLAHWKTPNLGATNISGFTALPAGINKLSSPDPLNNVTELAYFWSTTPDGLLTAYSALMTYSSTIFNSASSNSKAEAMSVRLIKNIIPTTTTTTTSALPTTTTTTTVSTLVTICDQTWMLKNLDVTTYRNGDTIPQATTPTQWVAYNALGQGCWAYPNYNSINGNTYGKLYNWHAVNDPRGLAPIGYHVPTYAEFQTLITCLGGSSVAGGELKQTGLTTWQTPNTGATNSSGFTALGAGQINSTDGIFSSFNRTTKFITTNTWSGNSIYTLGVYLYYNYADVNHFVDIINKKDGSSIRLIKD
jgi:uncharacterized protein (TIGR02145 family)